jgi:Family of unknown function (DUF5990)
MSPTSSPARRARARSIGTLHVRIEATDLPGRRCGPDPDGLWYENVHVGLARGPGTAADDLVPGDADRAVWEFDIDLRATDSGELDFGGPYVLGPRDERHLGLRWLREDAGEWILFRAAKFRLFEMDRATFDAAARPDRRLVGRLGLTDEQGWPRCATVRPPLIDWSVE